MRKELSYWDKEVRQICGNDGYWFAPISPETGEIISGTQGVGEFRNSRASKDLKDWLERVNLPFHSPHKFRHGNAVYSIKRAKDVSALKAISQNLMHSSISITDGVYGVFSQNDVKAQIKVLGKNINVENTNNYQELLNILENILSAIKDNDLELIKNGINENKFVEK